MLDGSTITAGSAAGHAHLVQLYRDDAEIAASVTRFLAEGLVEGEPAIAIASDGHRHAIAQRLGADGFDAAALQEEGRLMLVDAEATLATILDDGVPSEPKFDGVVGGLIERASETLGGAPVRAYGEMVDILWQRGDATGAIALEELWNRLAERTDFSLLCGYRIDIFDRAAQVSFLPQVCQTHSGMIPGADVERVERAVERALTETLGRTDAEKIYSLVGAQVREESVPPGQLALMWVSANMPRAAERVLAAARDHYAA